MRKNHNSLKSDRKRKTLRDTSLTCDTNKFGSKKSISCSKCGKKFLSIGPYNRLCEKCVSQAWKTFWVSPEPLGEEDSISRYFPAWQGVKSGDS